jgi:hypothetical protein
VKKFIFLDLDGVLNHENFYVKYKRVRKESELWHERYFCPYTVDILNNITDSTKAKIVFSSSHRFHFETFVELKEGFKLAGITGELIGITPKLRYTDNSYSVPRGCEIKAWMENNKGILGTKMTEVKYAILDDDTDMLYWQRNSFFCTKGKGGLTKAIANKVIKHLNKI